MPIVAVSIFELHVPTSVQSSLPSIRVIRKVWKGIKKDHNHSITKTMTKTFISNPTVVPSLLITAVIGGVKRNHDESQKHLSAIRTVHRYYTREWSAYKFHRAFIKVCKKSSPMHIFFSCSIQFIERASITDCNQLTLFHWQNNWSLNMSLPDKCISLDSHAMGVYTIHEKSITSRVQSSYMTPMDGTFISSSSSFQTNLPRNITNKQEIHQKNIS